jgi:hypothetical protein
MKWIGFEGHACCPDATPAISSVITDIAMAADRNFMRSPRKNPNFVASEYHTPLSHRCELYKPTHDISREYSSSGSYWRD